tara:strand:- start:1101 stop:1274 length:174 start_codon:yes stop_codon:yes gene_type:complete
MKYNDINFITDELVETFARMNKTQRENFCECLSRKWPGLAQSIATRLVHELVVQELD